MLCLAEGEGRNAMHLAQLGHRVLAQSRGVTIQTCCGDLAAFHPALQSVDLVVTIWMHLPPQLELLVLQERRRWIEEGPYHHGDSAVVQALGRKPL